MPTVWYEPTLLDLLYDPLVLTLMARDGTSPHRVEELFESIRRRQPPPPRLPVRIGEPADRIG